MTAARRPLARAAIVAVGSELLTPLRVDTNSLFITAQLNTLGVEVVQKTIVGDDREMLAHVVDDALARVDLVVVCGGLGPTDDDVTREAVAGVLGRSLSEDPAIVEEIRARFASRRFQMAMPEINRRQALVPEGAVVVPNTRGSAPGLWLEDRDRIVLLLPGPPRELEPMLTALVSGALRERTTGQSLVRRVVRVVGRIESQTDEVLQPLYREWRGWPVPVAATILASLGQIELQVSARADSEPTAAAVLATAVAQVEGVLGSDVYGVDDETLESVLGRLLAARGLWIGVAESCTGGLVTSRLTDVPGSSRYLRQSIVAYGNEAKIALLGVPTGLLSTHGAVSEPVAVAMAEGIRRGAGVDIGIGVTGIAGPEGGSADKPVGTVAIAVVTATTVTSRVFFFGGERQVVKFQATQAALDMARRVVLASDASVLAREYTV